MISDGGDTHEHDGKLKAFCGALRKRMNDRGLSGEIVAKVAVPVGVVNLELGWSVSMDSGEAGGKESLTKQENAAVENVDTFLGISNDIKRKAFNWKVPLSVNVEMLLGFFKLEATLDVDPVEEKSKGQLADILNADWGDMSFNQANQGWYTLKSQLIHREGEKPINSPMSKWGFVRSVSNKFDSLKDSIISSARSMGECGYHGSIIAAIEVKVPDALTFGMELLSIKIEVSVRLQDLIAAQKMWVEDEKNRNQGRLNIELMEGKGLPVMDSGLAGNACDPYVIACIEGGKREHKARSITIKNKLDPTWNEVMAKIPCARKGETLVLSLYDEDAIGKDEFIDEWVIPLDKLEFVPSQSKIVKCPLKGKSATESYIQFKVWWTDS